MVHGSLEKRNLAKNATANYFSENVILSSKVRKVNNKVRYTVHKKKGILTKTNPSQDLRVNHANSN